MRALAHPLRIALLEALAHAGTLTATQASDMLGESPANCAFHLRTLAKYGYVEEAGSGRGRERPWRRVDIGFDLPAEQPDAEATMAAAEVGDFWMDFEVSRARAELSRRASWPAGWHGNWLLGISADVLYLTMDEAREFGSELRSLLQRFDDRLDHPERRPPGAIPVEVLKLAYPLRHLIGGPAATGGTALPGDAGPGDETGT